jgi:hypothetical protein
MRARPKTLGNTITRSQLHGRGSVFNDESGVDSEEQTSTDDCVTDQCRKSQEEQFVTDEQPLPKSSKPQRINYKNQNRRSVAPVNKSQKNVNEQYDAENHPPSDLSRPRPHRKKYKVKSRRVLTEADRRMEEENYVRKLLARRSMHLPDQSWCGDWIQFIRNNHPLFGLCLHHPLHPLQFGHRIFILIGSIAFGLTATNGVYLWYAYSNEDMNEILVQVSLGNNPLVSQQDLKVTHGMVALWTWGCILHSMFDISLWFLTACICFLEGGPCGRFSWLRSIGSFITVAIVAMLVAISSFVVAGRAIYEARLQAAEEELVLNDEQWLEVLEFESFSFLLGFGVESILVYFAYYPLFVTIGFSGALSPLFRCFPCIKFLGGRPAEIKRQLEERKEMSLRRGEVGQSHSEDKFETNMVS